MYFVFVEVIRLFEAPKGFVDMFSSLSKINANVRSEIQY